MGKVKRATKKPSRLDALKTPLKAKLTIEQPYERPPGDFTGKFAEGKGYTPASLGPVKDLPAGASHTRAHHCVRDALAAPRARA